MSMTLLCMFGFLFSDKIKLKICNVKNSKHFKCKLYNKKRKQFGLNPRLSLLRSSTLVLSE